MNTVTNAPVVSICIPTYNGKEFLVPCVESALQQDFQDIEIIICDDGSTDGTLELARRLAQKDRRIQVQSNPKNLGLVPNWNATLSHARGQWIKFLFQDDLLYPNAVSAMLELANRSGGQFIASYRDFIFSKDASPDRRLYHENAHLIDTLFRDREIMAQGEVAEFALSHVGINFVGEPSVTLIHRDVFTRVGLFDATLAQRCDTEFWVRAGLVEGVAMVRAPLAAFRVHGASTSASNYAARRFADTWGDPLILMHHYIYNRNYLPVRSLARQRRQLWALKRTFWDAAHDASSIAKESASAEPALESVDWIRLCTAYPRLKKIPWHMHADRMLRRVLVRNFGAAKPDAV